MLFKKEFDIDKDFFEEEERPAKRKVAVRVFVCVLLLTFGILCYSAYTFNLNTKFGIIGAQKDPDGLKEAQEYFYDAIRHYDSGDYDKAIESLNKQLAIVDDPDAYTYLAKIYLEKEEVEHAIRNFEKALEYKPDDFEANYELGKIYFEMHDYKKASKYLTAASNEQIDNAEVLGLTAESYKMTGHADDAIILFEKIIELNPDSYFANAKIGEIYYQRLQYKKAVPYFEEALKYTFEENTALQLAKSYMELGNFNAALDTVNEVLASDIDNTQAASIKRAIEYKKGLSKKEAEKGIQQKLKPKEEPAIDKNVLESYIKEIELSIKTNWTPPVGSNFKKASVKFTVNKEGKIISNSIYSSSGMSEFDKSALEAIEMSEPFPPLPDNLHRNTLDIVFTFDFNIKD